MSDAPDGICATILVGNDPVEALSLGKHEFIVLPSVGEDVVVVARGENHVLKEISVTHFGHSLDFRLGELVPARDFYVHILCKPA